MSAPSLAIPAERLARAKRPMVVAYRFIVRMPNGDIVLRTNERAWAVDNMRRGFICHGGTLIELVSP